MENKIEISFFQNIYGSYNSDKMNIVEVFDIIKSKKYSDIITSIRYASKDGNKEKANEMKKQLPAFSISVLLQDGRRKEHISRYNQLIHLDIDGLDIEEVEELKQEINKLEYTYSSFISPSGRGIKVFIMVDSLKEHHLLAYNQVCNYYKNKLNIEIDESTKDINRLCYVSFDEKLYLNKCCKVFKINKSKKNTQPNKLTVNEYTIQKGERHSTLLSEAGKMRRIGMESEEINSALIETNKKRCKIPLPEEEIKSIAKSVCNYKPEEIEQQIEVPEPKISSINPAAFDGLPGEFLKLVGPHSEAHPMGILLTLLTYIGCYTGRSFYFGLGIEKLYPNLFICLVGKSSLSRKGTSMRFPKALFNIINPDWLKFRSKVGLSSGEGLISLVKDDTYKMDEESGNEIIDKKGEDDKRLLVVEPEFANVLQKMSRQGNTLSGVIRSAWDSDNLGIQTKEDKYSATNPHINIIGQITPPELNKLLNGIERANGFANRFIWIYVYMSKKLPIGGKLTENDLIPFSQKIMECYNYLSTSDQKEISFNEEASKAWEEVYDEMTTEVTGKECGIIDRGTTQVLKLAIIYAFLDKTNKISIKHLNSALAIWRYCLESVTYIFNNDKDYYQVNKIFEIIKQSPNGVSKTEIYSIYGNHISKEELNGFISLLIQKQRIVKTKEQTGGRAKTIFKAK